MNNESLYSNLLSNKSIGKKCFTVLVDPDKVNKEGLLKLIHLSNDNNVDYFFVGGSLLSKDATEWTVATIKENSSIPVILFPSNSNQIVEQADGILFLSLISGRNADYLIGQQVISAPLLKQKDLEVLSCGYMLVDCGKQTTASYISNTTPLPYDKPEIAVATAMAGEMLGLKLIYADGGSGAKTYISPIMISALAKNIETPLIVGGGLRTVDEVEQAWISGADVVVVGNHIEKNPNFIAEVSLLKSRLNVKVSV